MSLTHEQNVDVSSDGHSVGVVHVLGDPTSQGEKDGGWRKHLWQEEESIRADRERTHRVQSRDKATGNTRALIQDARLQRLSLPGREKLH